jgi:hypothetical protein
VPSSYYEVFILSDRRTLRWRVTPTPGDAPDDCEDGAVDGVSVPDVELQLLLDEHGLR